MNGINLKKGKNGAAPVIRLNCGYDLPAVGLGTYALHGIACVNAVYTAIQNGYRLIDTASFYGNEREVGEGIRKSGVPRSEIFVQTKLYPNQYGHAEKAIDEALRKLEHFQSDLMDRHYDEVENMYRTMRGWRHDYHNHIQAVKAYAELGKYGELIAYLGRLDENLYQVDTVIKTGNLMMDAVLGSKLGLMKKRGIRTDVTVHVPKGMKLTDMELCVLVGNLLDNAIEACEEVEEEENRFIRIYMDTLQEQFYLSVMNGMNGRAQRKGTGFVSRKRPGGLPGFGLQRVDRIVEKYGGFLNRQTEEGVFATEILLPLAVQGE